MKDLWISVSGALAQQKNVETIANNIANANTAGFKKDELTFKEYITALDKGLEDIDLPNKEWAPEDFYRSYGAEHAKVKVDSSFTIFQQGQLTPSGNPLDLALNGKGFFEVLTPNGVRFTRKGTFSLNNEGIIVTNDGFPILKNLTPGETATNPSDRVIKLSNSSPLTVNLQGDVYQNGQPLGKLSIVDFRDPHALRKEGNSFFINKFDENILPVSKTAVHQGFVEQSNVNAVEEMSKLIKANRNFESIQKAIKAFDNITGKAVNELTRF